MNAKRDGALAYKKGKKLIRRWKIDSVDPETVRKRKHCIALFHPLPRPPPPDVRHRFSPKKSFSDGRAAGKRLQPRWGVGAGGGHRRTSTPEVEGHKGIIGQAREWSEESTEEGEGSEGTGGDEGSSSVHMRMFSRPNGDGW